MGQYDAVERWYIVIMKTKTGTHAGFKFVQATSPKEAREKGSLNEFGAISEYLIDCLIDAGENKPYIYR